MTPPCSAHYGVFDGKVLKNCHACTSTFNRTTCYDNCECDPFSSITIAVLHNSRSCPIRILPEEPLATAKVLRCGLPNLRGNDIHILLRDIGIFIRPYRGDLFISLLSKTTIGVVYEVECVYMYSLKPV